MLLSSWALFCDWRFVSGYQLVETKFINSVHRVASNVTRRRFPPAAASRPEAPGGPLRSIRSRFTAAAAAHLQDPRPVKVGARYWPVQLQGDAAQDLHPRIQVCQFFAYLVFSIL